MLLEKRWEAKHWWTYEAYERPQCTVIEQQNFRSKVTSGSL